VINKRKGRKGEGSSLREGKKDFSL